MNYYRALADTHTEIIKVRKTKSNGFWKLLCMQQPVLRVYLKLGGGTIGREVKLMDTNIIIAAATAFIVSVVCCRISALMTFRAIDKYVADIIEMAKESIRNAYSDK